MTRAHRHWGRSALVLAAFSFGWAALLVVIGVVSVAGPLWALVEQGVPVTPTSFLRLQKALSLGLIGSVDEFRVWNGTLSQSEIALHNTMGPDVMLGKCYWLQTSHLVESHRLPIRS